MCRHRLPVTCLVTLVESSVWLECFIEELYWIIGLNSRFRVVMFFTKFLTLLGMCCRRCLATLHASEVVSRLQFTLLVSI